MRFLFFVLATVISNFCYASTPFHETVKKIISETDSIPGIQNEEFYSLREDLLKNWEELEAIGTKEFIGTDKEVRPYMVSLQAVIEHALASLLGNEVSSAAIIIHTPAPPTPLCTEGEILEGLVDSQLEQDPSRLFTVTTRPITLRNFMRNGGVLYAVYPVLGLNLRSKEMLAIYNKALKEFPQNLFERRLACRNLEPDMVGALYFITLKNGDQYGFAIHIPQAIQPNQTPTLHQLWFGQLNRDPIQARFEKVLSFLSGMILQPFKL